MQRMFLAVCTATAFMVIGCGSGDSKAVTSSKLKGTWKTECRNLPDNTSEETVLLFTKEKLTKSAYTYDDIGCKSRDIMKHINTLHTYTLGEDVTTADGKQATKISTTVTGFEIVKGSFVNDEIPAAGTVEKHIIFIDANKLYFGEDQAPYQLNYQEYFSKVK